MCGIRNSVVALILLAPAVFTASCNPGVDDVNVRGAVDSGVEYSFVIWRADIPERLEAGGETELEVSLINNGRKEWKKGDSFSYCLSYHWKHPGGRYDNEMFWGLQTPLPEAVYPGEMVEVKMKVKAPAIPKLYDIVIDIVRVESGKERDGESAFWFEVHDESKKQAFDRRIDIVSR